MDLDLELELELESDSNSNLPVDDVDDEKLEDFGEFVENLIGDCPLDLCEQTQTDDQSPSQNQNQDQEDQVAAALQLDADQNSGQNSDETTDQLEDAPPENVSKKETVSLPDLIQKMCKVKSFIGACKKTGNKEKDLIDLIDETDFSTSTLENLNTGIRFNVPAPIEFFCGRQDFLKKLHENLKMQSGQSGQSGQGSKFPKLPKLPKAVTPFGFPISSQLKTEIQIQIQILGGLEGVGKTETARKYIGKYGQFYNNVIWIEAETENSISNSFLELAAKDEIQIPVEDSQGKGREIKEIAKEIYSKICEGGKADSKSKPSLIIFDNAEDYSSVQKFLPVSLQPDLKKSIVILATSRNQDQEWNSPTGKIAVLPLDVLTENECLQFTLKQLEIPRSDIPQFQEESKEFMLIGGLPLTLQQAVAYIKQEKIRRLGKIGGKSYEIPDYIREFKRSMNKFRSFFPIYSSDSSATVFFTWNVTVEKIPKLENGAEAVKILEIVSFLYADKIPSSFLHDLVPELTDEKFGGALELLEKYSLIKMKLNDSIKIHRTLQSVILQYLKRCEEARRIRIFMSLVDKCSGILENLENLENQENLENTNESDSKSSDIFLNIHQVVNNPFNNLILQPMAEEFLDFVDEFGWVLWESGRYSESLDVWQKVHAKYKELLGEQDEKTLDSEHHIALNLQKLGRLDESLRLFKENLGKKEIAPDFGPDHSDTIEIKHNIAAILRTQKKGQASLFWFQQVLAHRIKNQEENHPETLAIQDQMAQIHTELGNFSKALALYVEVERKQKESESEVEAESPDPDHQQNSLITKQNKAAVLYQMGKFRDASKTFKEIHEKQTEILGKNHPQTISTLDWIAKSLEQTGPGKLEEALQLYNNLYQTRRRNLVSGLQLGEDHPQTIQTKYNIAAILRQQKKHGESLPLFQQVLLQQVKLLGGNHPDVFKTQNSIALLHSEQGDFTKAMEMLEGFEKERIEILGGLNEHVLETKQNRAVVLYGMDQFQEASKLFHEVYDKRKESLGDNHKETMKSLEWITATEERLGTLTQAVETWTEVVEIRKKSLDQGLELIPTNDNPNPNPNPNENKI